MRMLRTLGLALTLPILAACAAPLSAYVPREPQLAGGWEFTVQVGAGVTRGAFELVATGDGYGGTLTTDQGNNVLPIRSLEVGADGVRMVVESPNGLVVFAGALSPDARSMDGVVTYHNGQRFPMSVKRR